MHELALLDELCQLALQTAHQEGAHVIHSLHVQIGDLCGVNAEALRQAFAVLTLEPTWEDTRLELEVVRTRCFCPNCKQAFNPTDLMHQCPRCGHLSNTVLQGHELVLVAIEVS